MRTHIDDNAHLSGRSEHINKFPPPKSQPKGCSEATLQKDQTCLLQTLFQAL